VTPVEIRINGERVGELPEGVQWNDYRTIARLTRHNPAFLARLKGKVLGDVYYSPAGYVNFKTYVPGAGGSGFFEGHDNGLVKKGRR
jgi:hypothetical protein